MQKHTDISEEIANLTVAEKEDLLSGYAHIDLDEYEKIDCLKQQIKRPLEIIL